MSRGNRKALSNNLTKGSVFLGGGGIGKFRAVAVQISLNCSYYSSKNTKCRHCKPISEGFVQKQDNLH
jgi:hypothetical protein